MSRHLFALVFLFALVSAPGARAEVNNCTQITSLPTTITTQGTYCLKADLSTALASGAAITVATNNVILDCNQFKIGGLAAGLTTTATGVTAVGRNNLVIRNCNIRGFRYGVFINGGAGHVIEDNRMDGNTFMGAGIFDADGTIIRRNHVVDTGGSLPINSFPSGAAYGIGLQNGVGGIMEDNSVVSVAGTAGSNGTTAGILVFNTNAIVRRNGVMSVIPPGTGPGHAVSFVSSARGTAVDNVLINPVAATAYGVNGGASVICARNLVTGFSQGATNPSCVDGGGNVAN